MTPPPPGMRFDLRRGFVEDGSLTGRPSDDLLLSTEDIGTSALERHRAAMVGVIVIGVYILIMLALTAYVAHAQWSTPAPGPTVTITPTVTHTVTPTTYGPPGPTGGPLHA